MRSTTKLMKNWQFTGPDGKTVAVDLPHTWNNIDGQDGGNDYWRGTCTYKTQFAAPAFDVAAQQVWLQFEGVNASARVTLNGVEVASHNGGYSTFRADITTVLGENNELTVEVDNSKNDRVYPQKADFTFYGGIYRDVTLLVVNKNHLALDYLGGPGVQITPTVNGSNATSMSRAGPRVTVRLSSRFTRLTAARPSPARAATPPSRSSTRTCGTACVTRISTPAWFASC